jgi:hypothetical protein
MMPRMKALLTVLVLALTACDGNPASPVNVNTWHECVGQGGWCPNWTDCPPVGYEANGCETNANAGPGDVGVKLQQFRQLDAGQ